MGFSFSSLGSKIGSALSGAGKAVATKASGAINVLGVNIKNSVSQESITSFLQGAQSGAQSGGLFGAIAGGVSAASATNTLKSMDELSASQRHHETAKSILTQLLVQQATNQATEAPEAPVQVVMPKNLQTNVQMIDTSSRFVDSEPASTASVASSENSTEKIAMIAGLFGVLKLMKLI